MNVPLVVIVIYVLLTCFGALGAYSWRFMEDKDVDPIIQYVSITGMMLLISVLITYLLERLAIP